MISNDSWGHPCFWWPGAGSALSRRRDIHARAVTTTTSPWTLSLWERQKHLTAASCCYRCWNSQLGTSQTAQFFMVSVLIINIWGDALNFAFSHRKQFGHGRLGNAPNWAVIVSDNSYFCLLFPHLLTPFLKDYEAFFEARENNAVYAFLGLTAPPGSKVRVYIAHSKQPKFYTLFFSAHRIFYMVCGCPSQSTCWSDTPETQLSGFNMRLLRADLFGGCSVAQKEPPPTRETQVFSRDALLVSSLRSHLAPF